MKTLKMIMIFTVIIPLLYSCDYEAWDWNMEGDPNYENKTFFSPPDWIIGKWESKPKDVSEQRIVFEFTSDNIIDPFWGDRNKKLNDYNRGLGFYLSVKYVKETKIDSMYTAVILSGNDTIDKYKFQKIDENTIIALEGHIEGQRALYKLEY